MYLVDIIRITHQYPRKIILGMSKKKFGKVVEFDPKLCLAEPRTLYEQHCLSVIFILTNTNAFYGSVISVFVRAKLGMRLEDGECQVVIKP